MMKELSPGYPWLLTSSATNGSSIKVNTSSSQSHLLSVPVHNDIDNPKEENDEIEVRKLG